MISATSGATFSASLRTGTTMETATAPLSEVVKSALIWLVWQGPEPGISAAWRRPLLWGESAAGNPFEAPGRGPYKGHNGAVALDRKPEPAGRKPVTHEHRADDADQCPGNHVTRMVGDQHQTGCRNDNGIDGHRNASLGPEDRHGESKRKGGRGVAGRKAVIGRVACEVREVKGVGLAADKRPTAADTIFQHFGDQVGHGDRAENELQPCSQAKQQRALDAA